MAFGIMIGIVAGVWFHDPNIGGVIAAAMLINMTAAALAGIAIPLFLDRAGADPAVSSAVFRNGRYRYRRFLRVSRARYMVVRHPLNGKN